MPARRPAGEGLDAIVPVRFSVEEEAQISEEARNAGITRSAYIRRRTLGRRVVANADALVLNELRRLGGLLKLVHTESGHAYSEQTAAALDALKSYIVKLANDR
jgi:hypothetical protein